MKIYINDYDISNISNNKKGLIDLLYDTNIYTELYTNEAIYNIDNNNIYLLEPKDGEIHIYKNYIKDVDLIVDNSYFEKKREYGIYGNQHIVKKIKKHSYKLNKHSKINLIIENHSENLDNNFTPIDIYFECNEIINIKELFYKQELIEFLLLLN